MFGISSVVSARCFTTRAACRGKQASRLRRFSRQPSLSAGRQSFDRLRCCSGRSARVGGRRCMRRCPILLFCAALRGTRTRVRTSCRQSIRRFSPTLAGTIAAPMQHCTGDQCGCQCPSDDEGRQRLRRYPSDRNRGCEPKRRQYHREINHRKLQIITETHNDHGRRRGGGDHVNRQFFRRQNVDNHRSQQPKNSEHGRDIDGATHRFTSQKPGNCRDDLRTAPAPSQLGVAQRSGLT